MEGGDKRVRAHLVQETDAERAVRFRALFRRVMAERKARLLTARVRMCECVI